MGIPAKKQTTEPSKLVSLPSCAWGAGRSGDSLVLKKKTRPATPERSPGRSDNAEGAEEAPAGRGEAATDGAGAAGPRLPGVRLGGEGIEAPPGAQGTPRPARPPRGGSHGEGRGEHLSAKPARCRRWRPPVHPRGARGTPPRPPKRGRPRRRPNHPHPRPPGAAARPRRSSPCGSAAFRGLRARTARSACGPSAAAAAAPRRSRTPPWRPQAPAPARQSVCLSVDPSAAPLPDPVPAAAPGRGAARSPPPRRVPSAGGSARAWPGGSPPPASRRAPATPPANRGRAAPGTGQWERGPRAAAAANVGVARAANGAAERPERRPMGQRQDCGRHAPPRPAPGRPQGGTRGGPGTAGPGERGRRDNAAQGARSVRTGQNEPSVNQNFTALDSRTKDAGARALINQGRWIGPRALINRQQK